MKSWDYSNQRLVNEEGEYFEATGLEPDIPMTVFIKEDVMNGHYLAVQKIVNIIKDEILSETSEE